MSETLSDADAVKIERIVRDYGIGTPFVNDIYRAGLVAGEARMRLKVHKVLESFPPSAWEWRKLIAAAIRADTERGDN
jgi:hypothetical protein